MDFSEFVLLERITYALEGIEWAFKEYVDGMKNGFKPTDPIDVLESGPYPYPGDVAARDSL